MIGTYLKQLRNTQLITIRMINHGVFGKKFAKFNFLVRRFKEKFENYKDKVSIFEKKFNRSIGEYYYQKNVRELKNTVKAHIKTNDFLKDNKNRIKEAFKMQLFYDYKLEFYAKVKRKDLRMLMANRKKWN